MLTASRYEYIKETVVELFEKNNIQSIPIDPFDIAHKLGVRIISYSSMNPAALAQARAISDDGFSMQVDETIGPFGVDQWYICYNDKMSEKRIRFTLMHEIGHIVLDHTEASDLAESEANFFAKYALAPPPLVHRICAEDYMDIAHAFQLTDECASYAFQYYIKWLKYGEKDFTTVERRLLAQFKEAAG